MNKLKQIMAALLMTAVAQTAFSQHQLTGNMVGNLNQSPMPGVHIRLQQQKTGTVSDYDGNFSLPAPKNQDTLVCSFQGFQTLKLPVGANTQTLTLQMQESSIGLSGVQVIASSGQEVENTFSMNRINADMIREKLGDKTYPEAMALVPGIYAARTGGGAGDATLNIRGFKQDNIALLLNGVPISSVENGLMYWNNWLGLSDVTQSLQVQKGICSSAFGVNAIGGAVNIITNGPEATRGGVLNHSFTSYGNKKTTFSYNSGKMDNGFAVSLMGSVFDGDGYVDGTYSSGYGYFLSVSKNISKNHLLVFTALGNPESHGQRNVRLTQDEMKRFGNTYNKEWGSYNGEINNTSENFYHKPYITLNHYWNISEKAFLATSAYFSPGKGGGKWSESFGTTNSITDITNGSGQIDWDAVYDENMNHGESYITPDGEAIYGYAKNAQTLFHADHVWTGILSTLDYKISPTLSLKSGLHYRYFQSSVYETVADLLGGDVFIDDYAWSLRGVDGREVLKYVGDTLKVNNGSLIHFAHAYTQATYSHNGLYAFLSGSVNGNLYQRYDHYNYRDEDCWSEQVSLFGYDLRFGISKAINHKHIVYMNGGLFNRAPYFKYVFGNYTNEVSQGLSNENIYTVEGGYKYNSTIFSGRINAYYTIWNDRSFLANEYNQFLDPVLIQGLNARHKGVEAEGHIALSRKVKAGIIAGLGDWIWTNDVDAVVYNNEHVVVDTIQVFTRNLFVGDAPMTQLGGYAEVELLGFMTLRGEVTYYDRIYAGFDPVTRSNPDDLAQAWRMPAYAVADMHLSGVFTLFKQAAQFNVAVLNLFDANYLLQGVDGVDHTAETFTGFAGFGRTVSVGMTVKF